MEKIIEKIQKWFTSKESVKIVFNDVVNNFEEYDFESDLFFYGEEIASLNLTKKSIEAYFNRIELYIQQFINEFKFSNYNNFNDLIQKDIDEEIIYFLEWIRDENLLEIQQYMDEAKSRKYKARELSKVVDYYDYLVKESMNNNNYDATLDFLMGFISNISIKAEELTLIKSKNTTEYEKRVQFSDLDLQNQFNQYNLNMKINQVYATLEKDIIPAEQQVFFI